MNKRKFDNDVDRVEKRPKLDVKSLLSEADGKLLPNTEPKIRIDSKESFRQYIEDIVEHINNRSFGYEIDIDSFCNEVYEKSSDSMTEEQYIKLAMEIASSRIVYEPEYESLASSIAWNYHHTKIPMDIIKVLEMMYNNKNSQNGRHDPRLNKDVLDFAKQHETQIKQVMNYDNDYTLSYFSYSTLCKSYFQKINNIMIETAQDMFMRVALGIHYQKRDIDSVIKTYKSLSCKYYIHATPTLFNAGTIFAQNSSCFLLALKKDSLKDIYDVLQRCALISKNAGGIGINISSIRALGTSILGTGGHSNGIIPMLKVYNETARYCDQGGGKRKGSFAVYLEPWHDEIMAFLELRLNHGSEELRTRDLFTGLWIPDLFMKRVVNKGMWSLFCPAKIKQKYGKSFEDIYGDEFEQLYEQAEKDGIYNRQMKARDLWRAILKSQFACGLPYMCYKDNVNHKSNQKNIGTIRGSNLCTEIMEYTDENHDSVCNLASLSLPSFVKFADGRLYFDYKLLGEKTMELVVNLNRIIDVNRYPVKQAEETNKKHRPIGLGVQGLADVFAMFRYSWESEDAKLLNINIFETIYYHAVLQSARLGIDEGSYELFEGSPISKGILQPDMWGVKPITKYKWDALRELCKEGMRNSLLIAPMPTASTAQILGNNESIEVYTDLIYSRKVLSGEYVVVNKHLINILKEKKLWIKPIIDEIVKTSSVQGIARIPQEVKNIFRTVWETKQKVVLDRAIERSAFIDQSTSLNNFMARPTIKKLHSYHMYGWKHGLKTGMYYLRTKSARDAIKFTIMEQIDEVSSNKPKKMECTEEVCIMCQA